jgi:hypothetical protein
VRKSYLIVQLTVATGRLSIVQGDGIGFDGEGARRERGFPQLAADTSRAPLGGEYRSIMAAWLDVKRSTAVSVSTRLRFVLTSS